MNKGLIGSSVIWGHKGQNKYYEKQFMCLFSLLLCTCLGHEMGLRDRFAMLSVPYQKTGNLFKFNLGV